MGKPAGISPVVGTPSAGSPRTRGSDDRQRDNPKCHRFSGQQAFAEYNQSDRNDPDQQNKVLHLTELPDKQERPLEKIVPPPLTPKRLGNWVIAMVKLAPALKPTRMLSLISFTSTLRRKSHANRLSAATVKAARLAIWA